MNFLAVIWDVDPIIFSIGPVDVRWYSLAWFAPFLTGIVVYQKGVTQDGYPQKVFNALFYCTFIGVIGGARLGHCLFYDPGFYLSHPMQILNFRHGGLASHGASIGLLTGLWIASRIYKIPYLWLLDRSLLAATLGGGFVRLGNLMNSEIYGTVTELPWGFIFVRAGETLPKHPTQIYEAVCYFITFGILVMLVCKKDAWHKRPGLLFGVGLIGIFLSRFIIEFIKAPQEAFEQNMSLLMGQWLSIPFIILGIWFTVRALIRPEAIDYPKPKEEEIKKSKKTDNTPNIKTLSNNIINPD